MKLTEAVVQDFEDDQEEYGTKTALYNIIFILATELLIDLGIKGIRTKGKIK